MSATQQILELPARAKSGGARAVGLRCLVSAPIRVLDLYSGLRGWSNPWRERGHEIYCVELDERFPADHRNVMDFEPSQLPWKPDVVLASPPCTAFTVMQIGRNWTHDHQPKNDRARAGLVLLERTLWIIAQLNPEIFIIENPVGKMRRMPQLRNFERRNVTYCQYGERRMKPTDLWGGFPPGLTLKTPCKNGMPCHDRAPRGSTSGTQGMDSAESAKIPKALSLAICEATEKHYDAQINQKSR